MSKTPQLGCSDLAVDFQGCQNWLNSVEFQEGELFLAKLFGMQFRYSDDSCEVSMNVRDYMLNGKGALHGGLIAFMMDSSMGHLLKSLSHHSATINLEIQYMRPVVSGEIFATSKVLKKGKNVSFLSSDLRDQKGNHIAVASATFMSHVN